MPALIPTEFIGTITWLGHVQNREAGLSAQPLERIMAHFSGPEGESRGGLTRPSCSRVLSQYPRGTTIRNTRQFTVLCADDLARIAADMGISVLDPALLGANMVVSGLPDFSHLPPSSRLQAQGGATLTVDLQNRPCTLPAKPIEAVHPGFGAKFKAAAQGRRGVIAWVEAEGMLHLGQRITLHIPDQRPWADPRR